MAKTRAKRAADTTEPPPAEPVNTRRSKRSKKEPTPQPDPPQEPVPAEPEPIPVEPELPIDSQEINEAPAPTPTPGDDLILEDEEENPYADEPKEEPRASDLYLDTVNPLDDLSFFTKLISEPLDKPSSPRF